MPVAMEVIEVRSRCTVLQCVSWESNPCNSIISTFIYIESAIEHATPEMPLG